MQQADGGLRRFSGPGLGSNHGHAQSVVHVAPDRLVLGESLLLTLTLESTARRPQSLVVDYVVHHVKASGGSSPKVFKGWRLSLAPGETRTFVKRHAVRPITTRRYHAGRHVVEVQINGRALAQAAFMLALA